jgi:hypothetical protein
MSELTKSQLAALVDIAKQNPEWALQQAFRFGVASLSDGSTQAAIERAAELLDFDAESLREAHAPDNNWSGEAEAKADYDERKKVARALRGMIAG